MNMNGNKNTTKAKTPNSDFRFFGILEMKL